MSLVGTGGSAHATYICHVGITYNFLIQASTNLLLLRGVWAIDRKKAEKLNTEVVSCLDFGLIKKLEICLVVFDDSCGEIYQEQESVEVVVAGRHKRIHCICVKHNLFHQSKWSHKIVLKTNHVVLFSSPCDIRQIDHLKDSWTNRSSFEMVINWLLRLHLFFYLFQSRHYWIVVVMFQCHRTNYYNILPNFISCKSNLSLANEWEKSSETEALTTQKEWKCSQKKFI